MGDRTPDEIGALDVRTRGAVSGVASLNASKKVVEDPANATATPTASKIPIADGIGKLDGWVTNSGTSGTLIWDKLITGSAVTSVTTNGEVTLDGNAHGGYEFEGFWIAGSASRLRIYINNDQTNSNYRVCGRYDGVGSGTIDVADCYIDTGGLGANDHLSIRGTIMLSPDGYTFFHATVFRKETQYASYFIVSKTSSIANLTRLDIVCSVANGISVNSRFRLWRRI